MAGLPAKPFRAARVDAAKTDKYGDAVIDGRHRYPLGPERGQRRGFVELGAVEAAFYEPDGAPIATFERAYGEAPTRASDPVSQLALLCRKPGGWRNSAVRASIPESLSRAMVAMGKADRGAMRSMMRDVSSSSGFAATVRAMAALSGGGVPSAAAVALSGACIAGGRGYCHINANGDMEPCAFIHYSDSNIKEKTLLECYESPLFMAYRRSQPFNDNMLRPCPVLDNPGRLTQIVEESGARSTDLESPERACDYCNRCVPAAEKWAPVADELWNSLPKKKGVQLTGKMAKKS